MTDPTHDNPPRSPDGDRLALRLAIAVITVGLVLMIFRYFAPVILLAALPKPWREGKRLTFWHRVLLMMARQTEDYQRAGLDWLHNRGGQR